MNLEPSTEQLEIAASARAFLSKELPIARLRELGESETDAIDDATWRRCADLGWLALGLPEEQGGVGLGLPDEVMLFRELGRHLAPGPFRSGVLAARVAGDAGQDDLAGEIASGERRVGMEVDGLGIDVRAGDLMLRIDATSAELLEVAEVSPVRGVDPGVRFGRVTPAASMARVESSTAMDRARVLVAAELLGIIEAVRDMSSAYAQTRTQFDKPIGTFQAVKHRCADMAVAAYATTAELHQAALLVEAGADDASFHAAAAFVLACDGARTSADDNVQNHGGIGFTWEQDSHLYLKRAFLLERLLGPRREAYRTLLEPERHAF
jgi:alkylation response protein AidB-like acyl-CoA dehydrogenase